ncbi:helix-turn-helix domain-containing protein [Sphingobacterium psychroaquaticum]|uniref:AraC-type DNA-binding protein n=1 Tax=Sphingobacterium psychroaquaticum TaxID=561061 RepID=A0A1X7IML2_9SPHI|nr:AraC family transcriptional regulator [Sphingobacterium psychroaquaticum]SMG16214.1 AraC-type DNA-binding protein [Sphingobacterium psychroaquaticum]
MNKATANKIYIGRTMGVFVGQFNDNALHKHYALQISVTAFGEFQITDENNQHLFYSTCFISSNIKHRFSSDETTLIILINPISTLGHQLAARYRDKKIVNLDHELKPLVDFLIAYLNDGNKFDILIDNLTTFLTRFKCACENHFEDDRIYSAITYLENNFDRIVSLKEIAAQSFLSETRFLQLFKEKTNLNFRRYQLWNKLVKSLPALEAHSITETAHRFGFTDSSHYSRTFKETFGLSPKFLLSLK